MPRPALLGWIGTLALLGLAMACSRPDPAPVGRGEAAPALALWSYRDLTGSAADQSAFFEFAASHGVRELFLGGADLLPRHAVALARFLEAASSRGIAVSLVLGRAAWTHPDQRLAALEAVRSVREFDLAQRASGRTALAALQLDVEPHTLPGWNRDSARLSSNYLDLLESLRTELPAGLPLHVDIPAWWHGRPIKRQGRTRPLSEWVLLMADRTILMDYRNKVDAILEGAEGPLASAETLGRPVLVGLAVHCDRDPENAATSFCKAGEAALRKAMRQADARLSRRRSYAGFAIFTYEDWLLLRR